MQIRPFSALLLVFATSASAPVERPVTVSGHYRVGWEEQSFTPCGGTERWWVADPGALQARYRKVVKDRSWGTVFVTARVEVTAPGRYGHMGVYPRAVSVRRVVDARAPAEGDCARAE